MSTNGPDEIARFAARPPGTASPCWRPRHRRRAPGGRGEITVLVGGDEALFDPWPALQAMGGEILYMGTLGQAAVIKVITNMLAFVHLVASGEAMMLAKRGGLDLGKAYAAIRASSGNSFVHETETQLILNGSYDIGFTMDLACKDLGFATGMGRELGVPLELAAQVEQTVHPRPAATRWQRVVDRGGEAAGAGSERAVKGGRLPGDTGSGLIANRA